MPDISASKIYFKILEFFENKIDSKNSHKNATLFDLQNPAMQDCIFNVSQNLNQQKYRSKKSKIKYPIIEELSLNLYMQTNFIKCMRRMFEMQNEVKNETLFNENFTNSNNCADIANYENQDNKDNKDNKISQNCQYLKEANIFLNLNDCDFFDVLLKANAPFKKSKAQFIENSENQIMWQLDINTKDIKIQEATWCFVDIETTGSCPKTSNVLEIGAIKMKNNVEIARFNTLVKQDFIPDSIVQLTGIDLYMLENAPSIYEALQSFRAFLGDSIFVAHNARFDYSFLFEHIFSESITPMLNAFICTFDLAKKSFNAEKYGLSYLKEMLKIDMQSHRALPDALVCKEVFFECLKYIQNDVHSVYDLICFSKYAPNISAIKLRENKDSLTLENDCKNLKL